MHTYGRQSTFNLHFIMKTEKYHVGFTMDIKPVKDLFRTALLMDPQHMHWFSNSGSLSF